MYNPNKYGRTVGFTVGCWAISSVNRPNNLSSTNAILVMPFTFNFSKDFD